MDEFLWWTGVAFWGVAAAFVIFVYYIIGCRMREIPSELMEKLPDGLPRVSRYNEFLRITKMDDGPEAFVIWTQAAYTLMKPADGAT